MDILERECTIKPLYIVIGGGSEKERKTFLRHIAHQVL
jgi:hypothetical protein